MKFGVVPKQCVEILRGKWGDYNIALMQKRSIHFTAGEKCLGFHGRLWQWHQTNKPTTAGFWKRSTVQGRVAKQKLKYLGRVAKGNTG